MDADGRPPAILVLCDEAPSAEALATHITTALGRIVHAANEREAFRKLAQRAFEAAVLARQTDTAALEINAYLSVFGQ